MADNADSAASTKAKKADETDPVAGVFSADDRRAAVLKEYGKYVATARILAPSGAGAFNPGDPIPTSTIERDDLDENLGLGLADHWLTAESDGVALRSSAAGRAAVRNAGGEE